MKIIFIFLLSLMIGLSGYAQSKAKYKIKVKDKRHLVTRGFFYAAADDGITLVTNNLDTLKLAAEKISSLHIRRKGIIAPLMVVGAALGIYCAIKWSGFFRAGDLVLLTVPVGTGLGYVLGELVSNKQNYRNLEAKDFPNIKDDLQRYTEIK